MEIGSPLPVVFDYYDIGGIRVDRFRSVDKEVLKSTAIVCVVGGAHASWAWREHAQIYASAGYEVHALNWRGRNGSENVEVSSFVGMSILDVVDDIRHVVGGLGSEPILVGHSMGAMAGQCFASDNHIAALVLLTPVVPSNIGAAPIDLEIGDMSNPWGPPPFEVARQIFFQGLDDAQAAHFYTLLVPESPLRVHEATRWAISIDADKVTVPTLVVSGTLDILTPAETGASLAKLYNAKYMLQQDYGHNMLLGENARPLAQQVLQWLESC